MMRAGTLIALRATVAAAWPAREPTLEPPASDATAPIKLKRPNTAKGANATNIRPTSNGHAWGFQIVSREASPLMINVTKPTVRGPVSRRTTTADRYRTIHCGPIERTGKSIQARGPTMMSAARAMLRKAKTGIRSTIAMSRSPMMTNPKK